MGKASRKMCSVKGCENKHKAKGYCDTHYARYKRLGTVDLGYPNLDNLRWKDIEGFSMYEVSEEGHVRLKEKRRTRMKGHVLKGTVNPHGYKKYKLVNDDGDKREVLAHRLVINSFVGKQPSDKHQVAHWDGNPANNHYKNLRWATPQENTNDKYRHGTVLKGEENPRSILTKAQVLSARKEYKGKYGDVARLAIKYGVAHTTMLNAIKGENWKDIS